MSASQTPGTSSFEYKVKCPFDDTHEILPDRMPAHIVKCEKQHPNHGLIKCRFNTCHLLKKENIENHEKACPDRIEHDQRIQRRYVMKSTPLPPINDSQYKADSSNAVSGDWEDELDPTGKSYLNHRFAACTKAGKMLIPENASKTERARALLKQEREIVQAKETRNRQNC